MRNYEQLENAIRRTQGYVRSRGEQPDSPQIQPLDEIVHDADYTVTDIVTRYPRKYDVKIEFTTQRSRKWKNADGSREIEASVMEANDGLKTARIKTMGKPAMEVSWDLFSRTDQEYLQDYCDGTYEQAIADHQKQLLIRRRQAATARHLSAKANAKTSANAMAAARQHQTNIHNFQYQFNPTYRAGHNLAANRRASVARAYAYGRGLSEGRRWVPGYTSASGEYVSGCFK